MGGTRGTFIVRGVLITLLAIASQADAKSAEEAGARQLLAQKLLRLSSALDMKEVSFPESRGNGKDYNADDGNSFTSRTTYHSYVWSYCLQWVGPRLCRRWLDPYVSAHGFTGDQSPLEGLVGQEWKARRGNGEVPAEVQSGQYAIWNIEKQGGGNLLDIDGKLERKNLTKWELLPEVRNKVEKLGDETAVAQISITYDDSSGKGENTMPNMESLRVMAQRWTKMYRNRMVSILGQARAMERGSEFALGEDKATCDQYKAALDREMDESGIEERVNPQPLLDPDTKAKNLNERYQACIGLRSQSVYAVNPQVNGNNVQEGDAETEEFDRWRARAAIAAVDAVGTNPNDLPKPRGGAVREEEMENTLVDYAIGGLQANKVRMTNQRQLASFNDNVESAAVGMEEVSKRSGGYIVDNGINIRKFKLRPGTVNAVQLNGLTPEMKGELSDTAVARTKTGSNDTDGQRLENTPGELTITKRP